MSTFKIVVISIFAVSMVLGIAIFASSKGSSSGNQVSNLVVWGTISQETFNSAYKNSSLESNKLITIKYEEKSVATFDKEFVEALADGKGPDLVLLREDFVYKHRNRLLTIPYESYTERTFRDTFIEQGEIFLTKDGVLAIPFITDPLVMYWNRNMFSNNLISQTPKYWDEMNSLVTKMTQKDNSANILQSALAFGEYRNVTNAKEIISMLLFQAGTPITIYSESGVESVLNESFGYPIAPSQSAINFYTQFSNPTSPLYSWNRSLPSSLNMFLSGNLAMYIGFASEITSIQQKNSNLNFDVAPVPQIRNTKQKITFGHMYALAVVKQSTQVLGAFTAIGGLTETDTIKNLETITNLPPVRRDLLALKPKDAFRDVFYDSALISKSWIDPDSNVTAKAFQELIESVTSGRSKLTDGLSKLNEELSIQLR